MALVDNCNYTLLAVHPQVNLEILHNKEHISTMGDPDLLELAIMNILDNAVKYSSAVPHITVTVEEREHNIRLSVQDRGIGIEKEDLYQIFNRFYTVNKAHSRRLGGAGLGLSIVHKIINKHEGKVSVASKPQEGTTFTFEFIKHQPLIHSQKDSQLESAISSFDSAQ